MKQRRGVDADGYILAEADLAKVQPEYAGVPAGAAELLVGAFGTGLHGGYLYGSIVRGNAVPGRSDADLAAVLRSPVTKEDRRRARHVELTLQERFPVLLGAGVTLADIHEVRSPAQRYGLQVFLRELSVCICGHDLRPSLPRTRPSAEVAAAFHQDTHLLLRDAREKLRSSTDPEVIRRACRGASRRMVQAAFGLVMAREGVWATVLEEQAAMVGTAFPEWASAARRAAAQGRRPIADPGAVGELLETFGRWVEQALQRVVTAIVSTPPPPSDP